MEPSKCANCSAEASMRCSGCLDAPEYLTGDATGVVYCDRDCQTKHWLAHKDYCRNLQHRRKLLRAGRILKAALLAYRESFYDPELTKIEFKDGILKLYQSTKPRRSHCIFPNNLVTNVEHGEAALANNQCTTAMALLSGLKKKLLIGTASTMEVLDIHIGKPTFRTRLVSGKDSTDCPHTVLEVRLASNEIWVIDTAGCQYGFQDVLVPYDKYIVDKRCTIVGQPTTYSWTETTDLDHFDTIPMMNVTRRQKEARKLEREARKHFAVFVEKRVEEEVLDGSTAAFRGALDVLVQELKEHMGEFAKRRLKS